MLYSTVTLPSTGKHRLSPRRARGVARTLARPQLGTERLEARAMFNVDDGFLGDTAPPTGGPVFDGTINGNVTVYTTPGASGPVFNGPINGDVTVVVHPPVAPPVTAPTPPAAPSPDPLMPPDSWRDIEPFGIPLGTIIDYARWSGRCWIASGSTGGEFDPRDFYEEPAPDYGPAPPPNDSNYPSYSPRQFKLGPEPDCEMQIEIR